MYYAAGSSGTMILPDFIFSSGPIPYTTLNIHSNVSTGYSFMEVILQDGHNNPPLGIYCNNGLWSLVHGIVRPRVSTAKVNRLTSLQASVL